MNHRRPAEAIKSRTTASNRCHERVLSALSRLTKTGAPFTIGDVCTLSGVSRSYIYDKRHPELTSKVLEARNRSRIEAQAAAETIVDDEETSWRTRAINSESRIKALQLKLKQSEDQVCLLTGQLYDSEGLSLVSHVNDLNSLLLNMSNKLREAETEKASLRRSLEAARAQVKHERERNVVSYLNDRK